MSALLSNFKINNSNNFSDFYFKGEYHETDSYLYFLDGFITNQNGRSFSDLINRVVKSKGFFLRELQGQFFCIVLEKSTRNIYLFNDKYGIKDIFLYRKKDRLVISDSFMSIVDIIDFDTAELDKQALAEFLVFEYPILNKTFLTSIEYLPLSSFIEYNANTKKLLRSQYWDYVFSIDPTFDNSIGIETIDRCFDNFFLDIKKFVNSESVYGLGLSGGLDSRVVALYAKKYGLPLKTFIFGEKNSDAFFISNKIASLLELDHTELEYNPNFFYNCKKSILYNPMMNLLYTWYYSVIDKLPHFDILLTGFNGDNQFGSHISNSDLEIKSDAALFRAIINKYDELGYYNAIEQFFVDDTLKYSIEKQLLLFISQSKNNEYWQIKEEFNYKFRQRLFIKNNPSFNFFGAYKNLSPFTHTGLIDYLMTVPADHRVDIRLYHDFLKHKFPDAAKVRPERNIPITLENKSRRWIENWIRRFDQKLHLNLRYKKDHKRVWEWLKKNDNFMKFVKTIFDTDNMYFYTIFKEGSISQLINNFDCNQQKCYLLFRIMTIKLFLDYMINPATINNYEAVA